jgi:osmotically-inducible protein OsmY
MMERFRIVVLAPWLFAAALFSSCAFITGAPEQNARQESRYDDAGIKTAISTALLQINASKANDVNVHCFNGHVFLVGEGDADFRRAALSAAREIEGVAHVTGHWFDEGTASSVEDAAIESEIGARLLFTEDISTRRVDVDVWGGNVVLTGFARNQREIDGAVAKIRRIRAVKSVTSYLYPE